MEERLKIVVEADGTFTIKRQLHDIGRAGNEAAKQVRESWKAAYDQLRWQTKVAMNSTRMAEKERATLARQAERERVNAARAASQEVSRLRKSEAAAARQAAREAIASARAVSRAEVEAARAKRRAELAHRQKIRDAKNDATFGLGNFGSVIGLLGLRSAIAGFVEYSDSATNVANRLKIVTNNEQELKSVTELLRQSALDSRSEFDLTTRSYARLAQATKGLQMSQAGNLSMTETLTKAIAVSGATGAEAHATLIQLSQAMGSNRLSADEFRSVAEQLPIVLDLLADSTGVARTKLKEMGEEGKLTARVMALALLEGQEKIAAMFAKTTPTIEQSLENLKTQMRFTIDEFNKATGASKAITDALTWMAQNMDTVALVAKTLGAMIGVYLVTQIGLAVAALGTLAMANPFTAITIAATGAIVAIRNYREAILDTLGIEKELVWDEDGLRIANRADRTIINPTTGKAEKVGDKATRDQRAKREQAYQNAKKMLHEEYLESRRKEEIARLRKMNDDATKKKKKGRHIPTFDEAIRGLEDDVALLSTPEGLKRDTLKENMSIQSSIKRDLTEGEATYVQQLVKSRTELEMMAEAQKSAAEEAQKRYDAETKAIVELKREREEAQAEAMRIYKEQLGVENRIHREQFDSFGSEEDIRNARRTVRDMVAGGRLRRDKGESAMEMLEIQDPNTKSPRRQWLEEMHGIGKLGDSVNSIFGPDGSLNQGLADAAANAIVFKQSFGSALNALGKQIQAQIISTLIQAGIRMAILGAAGGATAAPGVGLPASTGGYITARGKGYAMGGYTGNNGRTRVAGHVHGGEYVVNANSTQRIGRGNLDVMNKTGQLPGGARGVNVKIINNSGVRIEAQPGLTREEVVLIAREENAKNGGRAVAGSIRDPNSYVGKALRGNTNVRYQR